MGKKASSSAPEMPRCRAEPMRTWMQDVSASWRSTTATCTPQHTLCTFLLMMSMMRHADAVRIMLHQP